MGAHGKHRFFHLHSDENHSGGGDGDAGAEGDGCTAVGCMGLG